MTIWRKRIACWITRATNTHTEYVIKKVKVNQSRYRPGVAQSVPGS